MLLLNQPNIIQPENKITWIVGAQDGDVISQCLLTEHVGIGEGQHLSALVHGIIVRSGW